MRLSKKYAALSALFVVTQLAAWTGCNAILGNGYGVDPEEADGAPSIDGDLPDGASSDGTSADGAAADGAKMDGGPSDGAKPDSPVFDSGCPNNVCPTQLFAVTGPQRIAVGSAGVYWVTASSIGLIDTAMTAHGFPLLGTIAAGLKRGVAVSPTGIPYVTNPDVAGHGAAECAADLSSCSPDFVGTAGSASSITTDATNVYLGIFDDGTGGSSGGIWRTLFTGASPTAYTMMTDKVLDLQIITGPVTYFRTATAINFNTATTAPASAANLAGDTPVAFVVHMSKLIIATAGKTIRACGLTPNCTTVVIQSTTTVPTAITADDDYIYWTEATATGGSVHRCDFPQCMTAAVIATGQLSPSDIVVDATTIYWANYGNGSGVGGAIMKLAK